jgi:epoxyqueuosine reductase
MESQNSLPALSHALLNDLEPLVRAHCAWALGEISGIEARDILIQAEQVEKEGSVLAEIRLALHKIAKS